MEGRNYIPPSALKPRQNLIHPSPPPHSVIGDSRTTVHHRDTQFLLIENQRLAAIHVALSQELSAARQDLRHLSAAAVKVKAERDAQVREVYDRAVKMEAEVKLIDESSAELALTLRDLQKLRSEKKELDEKLSKLRGDTAKVSEEWNRFPVMKSEIERMQKEIQRGREAIEHEKRVHASNIKQTQSMEGYKILMAGEIKKLQVEAIDAGKRARAAAAAEAPSMSSEV
ncbi:hypothetical protein L1987_04103 [Smallanthus sonchifolius]|uniref:Uncharacterized protein n=1 Tax=Smallanthus sonchifolius TaxID=185202 RepID=A0ACB9KCF4_9ASTR|nr:hypothetical protein L1987_04103 [Smallanthus sonchifolius]